MTWHQSDEESLQVDSVHYTNKDVDRAEMKYGNTILPQYHWKVENYVSPHLIFGFGSLAAKDLIDSCPDRSERGSGQ